VLRVTAERYARLDFGHDPAVREIPVMLDKLFGPLRYPIPGHLWRLPLGQFDRHLVVERGATRGIGNRLSLAHWRFRDAQGRPVEEEPGRAATRSGRRSSSRSSFGW